MNTLVNFLPIIQVVVSILLIISILLQQSEESLGGAFGGSDSVDTVKKTRRGADKVIFQATITLAVLFTIISIALVFA